jgi:putative membrane protein
VKSSSTLNVSHLPSVAFGSRWWALLYGHGALKGYGIAVLAIFTTALHSSLLGALLTFARTPWYPAYAHTAAIWGLTPLEDQQLG